MSDQRPIRLAVLGGESTGKTSLISRLTVNFVHEVHYPTRNQTNWLFDFNPHTKLAKTLLDGQAHERLYSRTPGGQTPQPLFSSPQISPEIQLSPLVFQAFMNDFTNLKNQYKTRSNNHIKHFDLKKSDNAFYQYMEPTAAANHYNSRSAINKPNNNNNNSNNIPSSTVKLPENYLPPSYTPISIDIIDTPAFNPDIVVPFLEVSLFRNLDKSILKGLANEPRKPVTTTTLLVASGASELNGKIDAYIFVYSAVPELFNYNVNPPDYNENQESLNPKDNSYLNRRHEIDGGYTMLTIMRNCILDAWTEFRNYQKRWELGKEDDTYSIVYNFKNFWKSYNESEERSKLNKLRSFDNKLRSIDMDPSSPNSPPPIIIVCTHLDDPMASPVLVEWGRNLATQWNCGFVAVDNTDDVNVDVALSLLIRELVEKEKLLSKHHSHHSTHGGNKSGSKSHSRKKSTSSGGSGSSSIWKIMK
ncbi:hypothetical protein NCAS_0A11300 [Naumovozyma castellii]|uniref:Uncharacterized protein n=1 Tax=Naumovozyma castellii TaxID=27288 RepID=G0V890_NAUCA|nr:hypothetical protein NCAS_0A11300 [Naumovozyma castellii CBS 4309]CCC67688.1 hypothetical protein NCAS_0A11300 [Naumovozyma castellii CBS 4309]